MCLRSLTLLVIVGDGPLYGPAATPDYSAATPTPGQAPPPLYQSPPEVSRPVSGTSDSQHNVLQTARPDSAQPQLPGPGQDFTDQWVSQVTDSMFSGSLSCQIYFN